MNYAVLIELSRKTINFRYYRDDAGNMFLPFNENEGSMPLAIYCQGNDIQMGQYALSEAEKHSLYAWNNVFDAVKQNGTFHYRGQDRNMNELLLVAIKKYLADFFDRILVKTKGTLEANISTMPLVFLFHQDIDRSDRLFVEKSFRDGGFVNLAALDIGCEIVGVLNHDKHLPTGKKVVLTVSSDGVNLIVKAIDIAKKQEIKSFRIMDKGIDPRLKYAVDKLWDSLDIFTYEMNKDNEYGILSEIASAFLASDDVVFQRTVMFSNGVEHECYLDKNQIAGIYLGTDAKIRSDMLNFIAQLGLQESDVAIVPYGNVAGSEYFVKNMKAVGSEVMVYKDPGQEKLLMFILDSIIAKEFKVAAVEPEHVPEEPQLKPLAPPHSTKANRVLRAAAHMTPQNAQIELLKLESELKKLSPQPSDLQQYLDRISKKMDEVKERGRQSSPPKTSSGGKKEHEPHTNPVGIEEEPQMPEEGSREKVATLPLSELSKFNTVVNKAKSEAPGVAVKHLEDLLEHVKSLNPSDLRLWSNRLKKEIDNAKRRLASQPKPVKQPQRTKVAAPQPKNRSKETDKKPIPVQLSHDEAEKANKTIMTARNAVPSEGVRQLEHLLAHIERLAPSDLKIWSNRLQKEIANAKERLKRAPTKPVAAKAMAQAQTSATRRYIVRVTAINSLLGAMTQLRILKGWNATESKQRLQQLPTAICSFKSQQDAQKLVEQLKTKGIAADIITMG